MDKSYTRKKANILPRLHHPPLDNKQKQLEKEVQQLDNVLKTDNLSSMHGLIFTSELKPRLAEDLLQSIQKKHRLISYGFKMWQSTDKPLLLPPPVSYQASFKKKLEEMSIQKIKRFEEEKQKQLSRMDSKKWKVARISHQEVRNTKHTIQTSSQTPKFDISQLKISHSKEATPQKSRKKVKKVITEPVQQIYPGNKKAEVTIEAIQKMLSKVNRLVSIWLPPRSYPQFYGIIVPSVTVTKTAIVKCRIRKYILFKQSLSARLFEGVIEFLSSLMGVQIDKIELIVMREDYRSHFQPIGFKIQSWEGVDKISISYQKSFQA